MGMMTIRKVAKNWLTPIIVLLVIGMAVGLFALPMINPGVIGKEPTQYVGPAAKVNGDTIQDADFNQAMTDISAQMTQYGMQYSGAQVRDAALSRTMQDVARNQEMNKVMDKINVNGADVDSAMKKYFPTEEELQTFMDQRGINKDDVRKLVVKQLQFENFLKLKAKDFKITVTKADIDKAIKDNYEQITVSHILIGVADASGKPLRAEADALKIANDVYQKVVAGGDFAQLSKLYSDDPGSKDSGGKIGPMPAGQFKSQMVPEFVAGVSALKVGEISKPVKTQYGYHIIKLLADTVPTGKDYDTKAKELQQNLLAQKTYNDPKFTNWLNQIYSKANDHLEILDPALSAYRLSQRGKWKEAAQYYEKAINNAYYKHKTDVYFDGANAYLKLNQSEDAIKIVKKVPSDLQDNVDFQIQLATIYKSENKLNDDKQLLLAFGKTHLDDATTHNKLKATFTDWQLTDLVAQEDKILNDIAQTQKELLDRNQQNIDKRNQVNLLNPSPKPTAAPSESPKK